MKLQSASEIGLPLSMPVFRDADQYIELTRPDGQRTQLTAFALETLLSPALICMPGRPGVLVPIQRDYAEHLLGHLEQMQLLPRAKALLYQRRHYLSSPRTLKSFQRGSLMFFYESMRHKGLKAVVAMARVTNAYLSAQGLVDKGDLDRSALEANDLAAIGKSDIKTVVAFSNLQNLPNLCLWGALKGSVVASPPNCWPADRLHPSRSQIFFLKDFQMNAAHNFLISLEERHASRILPGTKTVELRRRPMHVALGSTVWIYVKMPVGSIVWCATVIGLHTLAPCTLWRRFGTVSRLKRHEFFEYFSGLPKAFALGLSEPTQLASPIPLSKLRDMAGGFYPP